MIRETMSDKKKQDRSTSHPKLGRMIYCSGAWVPMSSVSMKVPLWGKVFAVNLEFMAKDNEQEINLLQEEIFEKFDSLMVEQNDAIEQMILKYYKLDTGDDATVLGERFIPTTAYFGRRGECLLEFQDAEMKEEEYGDDVYLGFALFLSPKLSFCDDMDGVVYMSKCWEGEDVARYIKKMGRDPLQELLREDVIHIKTDTVESEEERKEKEERFQLKYGQALLKYEEERLEKEKREQARTDGIDMPDAPLSDTIVGVILIMAGWAFLGGIVWMTVGEKTDWRGWVSTVLAGFVALGWTIGGGAYLHEMWSDYFLSRRDVEAYKRKMMRKEKNA